MDDKRTAEMGDDRWRATTHSGDDEPDDNREAMNINLIHVIDVVAFGLFGLLTPAAGTCFSCSRAAVRT